MALRVIQFLAIILTALALVPSGAHLAALPNKIGMTQAAYFVALRHRSVRRFGGESGAHDRAAQAGPIMRLCARLTFVHCCEPCHFLRLDLSDKSSDPQLDRCA